MISQIHILCSNSLQRNLSFAVIPSWKYLINTVWVFSKMTPDFFLKAFQELSMCDETIVIKIFALIR